MRTVRFLLLRAVSLVPVLIGITLATFVLTRVVPGDPARVLVGEGASAEAVAAMRIQLGLDRPLPVQYLTYVSRLVVGDLGSSNRTARPIAQELASRFSATSELAISSLILTILVGVPLGIAAALNRGGLVDEVSRVAALVGVSVPIFWLGLLLIILFYLNLGVVPAPIGRASDSTLGLTGPTGLLVLDSLLKGNLRAAWDALSHLFLPAVTLASWSTAIVMRITRASVLDVLHQDYVRTARAKGTQERRVIQKHVLRNALLPIITIVGLEFGNMLGGAVLTETVFNWPGMGLYAVNAIYSLDFAAVQGFTLVTAIIFVVINAAVDAAYALIDPRVRYS